MAERNPLGADASLSSGGLPSPATNASLSGPWAFLVQNAETGVRQQLRVDTDAGELAKRSDLSETERERGEGRGEEEGASLDSSATSPPADLVA